ncbi:DUF4276 family protein [Azospirillum sp. YIM B02556]|uniref:DUF4276 family protein n=1 Tax=Azospirillum endophyticum TaxID=2800326 RepID=A0ABS1F350_9PROT|nr:DUF4276 family protein [Azospirillum endophyticum]MBK1837836.1 DUF4276 family protein [Azospirillum endophyticum]
MTFIAPIVEGQGEGEAVPILLHRIAKHINKSEEDYTKPLLINPPIRIKATAFLKFDAYFSKHVALASAKAKERNGSVLILLDCEDDCPAHLGPRILAKAKAVRDDVPYLVVLASREFETWFMTAAVSLRGYFGLPADLTPPPNPESRRGAKEWLGSRMTSGYDPVTHQHQMTRIFDLEQAKANPSFRRFCERLRMVMLGK